MTAMNLIVQQDFAYLLTDRAMYCDDGVICAIGCKVVVADRLKAAIGYSGRTNPLKIKEALERHCVQSQSELLYVLGNIACEMKAENEKDCPDPTISDGNDLQLFVVLYSMERGRPEGWFTSTSRAYFPAAYEIGSVAQIDSLITPDLDAEALFGCKVNISDKDQFYPIQQGWAILQAQRSSPWIDNGKLGYFVGGGGDLTVVGAGGGALRFHFGMGRSGRQED